MTDLVDYLLAKLPPQAVLVIESRAFPRFELTHLIVHSAMFALNQESLRFSSEEILELAGLHGLTAFTHVDTEQLTRSFDGWITGILLGTYLGDFRILPHGQNTPLLKTNGPRRRNLLAYAINEIFQRDPAIYDFLQPASILQHMEAEMCNSLLGINNSASLLIRLEQQGFFITSSKSAEGETIYTCHSVIRDLLTTQLHQHAPDRFSTLHHQAAELWLAKQNYDQAMHHALEAEAYNFAVRLIIDTHKNFLRQGRVDTLALWLDALPPATREGTPHLLLVKATIAITRGQYTSTLPILDQISGLIASQSASDNTTETRRLQAETNILYAQVLSHIGDNQQALALCQQTLSELAPTEVELRATHTQREHVQAQLRLAACQLLRKQEAEMQHLLADVTSTLAHQGHYKQLVLVELQWLPELLQAIKHQPYLARLRELLSLAADLPPQVEEKAVSEVTAYSWPPLLSIRAFGEPVVLLDNQPIKRWRMARGMELFFFLLDADHPQSKEHIITEIWQDFDEQINQTFHSTLHYLRKLFGTSSLVLDADGYHLNLGYYYGERIWYDVQAFRAYNAEAEQALSHAGYSAARTALLRMVKLYRGDYGRPFYSNWCTFRRDELRTTYLNARRHLAQLAWQSEAFEECIDNWQSMLQIDNCLEEAHLGLMQCYDRQGNRSAALRQYQQCKEILHQELGIDVGSPIQRFYQLLSTP